MKISTNQANNKTLLLIEKNDSIYSLENNVKVFYDYSKTLKIKDISNNIFQPINDSNPHKRAPINWYTFQIYPTIDTKFITINFSHIDLVELYVPYKKGYKKEEVGLFTKKRINQNHKEKLMIVLETDSIVFSKPFYYANHLLSLNSSYSSKELPSLVFSNYYPTQNFLFDNIAIAHTFFLSALMVCFVLIVIMYLISNNINFLTYGLYLFVVLLIFSHRFPFFYNFYNGIHPKFAPILNGASHYLASMLYSYFIVVFINIKEKSKQLYTLYIAIIIAIFVFGTCITLFSIYKPLFVDTIYFLIIAFEIIITIAGVYIFIRLMRMNLNIVEKLIIFGGVVLVTGSTLTALTGNSLFFRWTAIVETIFFFSLISYQNMLNDKRRLEIQETLVREKRDKKMKEKLDHLKSKMYANISHEFRTPLTVILGMAETLKTNVLAKSFEGAEKSLEMIRRNGKNLLQLVNEMLDLAKVESGSMELNLVQTDAIPFVKYLSESFHSLAEAKNINLTVYSEIDALEMDVDVNKMASIISNLLSNAIKFTEANGKIIVHLNKIKTENSEILSIKIQDNGLGLAEDDLAHLFDRFYQADNQSLQYQEGTGIGLSLALEFVKLMNGTISVESTLGKGSTFTVQIPVSNNAVKIADAKITAELPIKKTANSTKPEPLVLDEVSALPLALLIEDNEDVAHYLNTCLKGKYQTMHASNGTMGIEMAIENIPDIIISDVMMPGKDGFEVCATLKLDARTDHIPIILLTAKATTEDRLMGLSHGADAYLAKPFNEKELFIRLDQLLLLRKKLIEKIQKEGFSTFLDKQAESPETKFLKKAIQCINNNIENVEFGSGDLAIKLNLSESQTYRKLKAITNKSTGVFIRSIRLQKAKELLQTTNKTISEIAYETGFTNPSWFSRAFKSEFGFAPNDISK